MSKTNARDNKRALIVKKVSEMNSVGTRYVYMVLSGDRDNEKILADYMDLKEKLSDVFNSPLLNAVNELIPFNKAKK